MAIVEIYYEAKCKHCSFLNKERDTLKDGSKGKIYFNICNNPDSSYYKKKVNSRKWYCDKFKL